MKTLRILIITLFIMSSCGEKKTSSPEGAIAGKVDSLLAEMTLKEKIGQMNQYSAGANITGPEGPQDGRYDRFVNGGVGSVLNVLGVEEVRKMQKLVLATKFPSFLHMMSFMGTRPCFPFRWPNPAPGIWRLWKNLRA